MAIAALASAMKERRPPASARALAVAAAGIAEGFNPALSLVFAALLMTLCVDGLMMKSIDFRGVKKGVYFKTSLRRGLFQHTHLLHQPEVIF